MTEKAISALAAALDRALVGQEDAKTGVLLALLAREHAYLEGPPGVGKSRLAEAGVHAASGSPIQLALHRDTRLQDLVGPVQLRREPYGEGQRLRHQTLPGPLLGAELVLLDDLDRAPAQALGPLLRILGERCWQGQALPLESVIATGGPERIDAYADPLEPGSLDRFAIQVRMPGLLYAQRWDCARVLLEGRVELSPGPVIDLCTRRRLQEQARRLPMPRSVQRAYVDLVLRLQRFAAGGMPLSDRTFGRAALRVLRAHALLRGASRVERTDLRALRYMLGRRLPDLTRDQFEELLAEAGRPAAPWLGPSAAAAGAAWGAAGAAGAEPIRARAGRVRSWELQPGARAPGMDEAQVERVLRALEGRFERGYAGLEEDPGGSPRSYRTLRGLDEVFDADPVELIGYLDGTRPGLPRSFRRERRRAGGQVALLRDVSASMEGRLGRWAGRVVAGLVRAGARRRMRIGYVEFNHDARRFHAGGRFFHRRYTSLLELAASSRAAGRTSYQAPLQVALNEFRARAGRNRHIVLLTDGVPVLGDPEVRRERTLARRLGVQVHTVFLGLGEHPPVLDAIARETGGLCFVGQPRPGGGLRVLGLGEGT